MSFFGKVDLSGAIASNAYVQGLPTRAMVAADTKKWVNFINTKHLQIVPDVVSGAGSAKKSVDWTIAALSAYGNITGEKVPDFLKSGIAGTLADVANFSLSNPTVTQWLDKGAKIGSFAVAGSTVAPEFTQNVIETGTVVIDVFKDGKVSEDEIGPLLKTASTTAGAVIGSIIPGLGTAIGATVGALVGCLMEAFASAGMQKKRIAAANKKADAELQAWAKAECNRLTGDMNVQMREAIAKLALDWMKAEAELGFRFDLRWFDPNPGDAFELAAYGSLVSPTTRTAGRSADGITGAYGRYSNDSCIDKSYRGTRLSTVRGTNQELRWNFQEFSSQCNFYCPNGALGCLYPTSGSMYGRYGGQRVVDALRARGFQYPVVPSGPATLPLDAWQKGGTGGGFCTFPTMSQVVSTAREDAPKVYQDFLVAALENNASYEIARFEVAKKVVAFDLARTIGTTRGSANVIQNQVQLLNSGVQMMLADSSAGLRVEHVKMMRNIAMAGGGALLLAALLGKKF